MISFVKAHYARFNLVGLILALIAVLILCLMPQAQAPEISHLDKLWHTFTFLVLAGLTDAAFPSTTFGWVKGISLTAYGVLIEILQSFTPDRMFSVADMVADVAGIGCYLLLVPLFKRVPVLRWRWRPYA